MRQYDKFLGINRTDGRCLDIVSGSAGSPPGSWRAKAASPPAPSPPLVDRLEAAGYLQRRRDTADRRKVFVEIDSAIDDRH